MTAMCSASYHALTTIDAGERCRPSLLSGLDRSETLPRHQGREGTNEPYCVVHPQVWHP